MKKILVGSRAFFSGMDGFNSKDNDFLILVDTSPTFSWRQEQHMRGNCTFYYLKETPAQMIRRTIDNGDPLLVGKFIVPEVAREIGATVNDILSLEPLIEKLDEKHAYEAVIFSAIKSNGNFEITEEQRSQAYEAYKLARKKAMR